MVTVTEAASELGVSGATINKRRQRGDMQGVKVNPRLWLIPADELDRWRGKGKLKPGPKRRTEE